MSGRKSSTRRSRRRRERDKGNISPDGTGAVPSVRGRGSSSKGLPQGVDNNYSTDGRQEVYNNKEGFSTKQRHQKIDNDHGVVGKAKNAEKGLTPVKGDGSPSGGGRERWWRRLFNNDSQQQVYGRSRQRSMKKQTRQSEAKRDANGYECYSDSQTKPVINSPSVNNSGFIQNPHENMHLGVRSNAHSMGDLIATYDNTSPSMSRPRKSPSSGDLSTINIKIDDRSTNQRSPSKSRSRRSSSSHKHHQLPTRTDFK